MHLLIHAIILTYTILSIIYIKGFSIKNTNWKKNSPEIIEITSHSIKTRFSVTEPATIYWRLYDQKSTILKPQDLTNTKNTGDAFYIGGNYISDTSKEYTNNIQNLSSNTRYKMYIIAVSYLGTFPKKVTVLEFTTKN